MGARHLRCVSEKRVGSRVTDAQEHLCQRAEGWANEVVALTAAMQEASFPCNETFVSLSYAKRPLIRFPTP